LSDSCRCDNISTCLDVYAEQQTLAQCVALGPLNGNSPFKIHESYLVLDIVAHEHEGKLHPSVRVDLMTTNGNIHGTKAIPIANVFIWVLKAGEFVKACETRFSNEG
jgi:hypothetical protein